MAKASEKANHDGLDQLKILYARRDSTDLLWFDEVGRLLVRLESRDVGLYGRRFVSEAANKLQGELSVRFLVAELSAARQFVGQFPKRAEVKAIVTRARRQKMKFGVSHARYLLPIADLETRRGFIEQCLEQRLTGAQLRAAIRRDRGQAGKTAGRPLTPPATLEQGLHNLLEHCQAWLRRYEEIWFDGPRPLTSAPDQSEKPQVVEKLLRDARRLLRRMAKAIDVALPKLAAAEQRAKKPAPKGRRRKGSLTPAGETLEHLGDSWFSR